jgi:hypothetical protein
VSLRFPKQDLGLRVDLTRVDAKGAPVAQDGAEFALGEAVVISVVPEAPAWLLVLNIDTEGVVSVLHRSPDRGVTEARAIVRTHVSRPVGADYVKAMAFRERPAGIDQLLCESRCAEVAPGDPRYGRLLLLVDAHASGRAETMVRLLTTE